MELRHYFDILKRRAAVIVIVVALAIAVVAIAGLLMTPEYTAGATVRVYQDVGILDLRIRDTELLMNTYGRVLTSWPILEQAAERLGSPLSPGQLREKVKVEVIPNTELMWISVRDHDPAFAAVLANTLSELLVGYTQNLYTGGHKSALQIVEEQLASMEDDIKSDRRQLEALLAAGEVGAEVDALTNQIMSREDAYDRLLDRYELTRLNESLRANSIAVIAPAVLPRVPSNSLGMKQVGLSLVVGLFGGIGLALVLENLDTRIYFPQQVEHLACLPVLGAVPKGLLSLDSPGNANGSRRTHSLGEAYRLLSANLLALREDVSFHTVLITSAVSKEGKSMVAANLSQTFAERGQTVFLVETDLRRPIIAKMLDIDDGLGLGDLLVERQTLDHELLSQITCPAKQPSLFVIRGGPKMANPTSLLASPSMDKLLHYLGDQGQVALLDAPPVLGVADVSVLVSRVDGVILVVRQAHSRREQVLAALRQLQASRAHVLGFIFVQKGDRDWGYG